ncbi:MAG: bifunctional DNA primase/polymerase, partial [Proteobacteria bacterium]|nr:bifunctional DNA primase/polymerase [Pseudomonadota bacterium]
MDLAVVSAPDGAVKEFYSNTDASVLAKALIARSHGGFSVNARNELLLGSHGGVVLIGLRVRAPDRLRAEVAGLIAQHVGESDFVLSRSDGEIRLYRIPESVSSRHIDLIEICSDGVVLPMRGDWRTEPSQSYIDDVPEITRAQLDALDLATGDLARQYDLDLEFDLYPGSIMRELAENGYHVLPILPHDATDRHGVLLERERGKAPGYRDERDRVVFESGWSTFCTTPPSASHIDMWAGHESGVGIACGKVVAVDVDIDDVVEAQAAADAIVTIAGVAPSIVGNFPKFKAV